MDKYLAGGFYRHTLTHFMLKNLLFNFLFIWQKKLYIYNSTFLKTHNFLFWRKYSCIYTFLSKMLKGSSVTFSALKLLRRCNVSCSNRAALYCWIIFPMELWVTKNEVSKYWSFRGPYIVIYSYNECQEDVLFLRFIW
jgi:hypothetical protein